MCVCSIIAVPQFAECHRGASTSLHPSVYCHICNNINTAPLNESSPACIINAQRTCLDTMVCTLHPQHKCHQKTYERNYETPPFVHLSAQLPHPCFPISVINERLFHQEMRFPFPFLLFLHLSPLLSPPLTLHPHLTLVSSRPSVSPFPLFSLVCASSIIQLWVSFQFISLFSVHTTLPLFLPPSFLSVFLSPQTSPPGSATTTPTHICGSQLMHYLLKMSSFIKIHDCATYVFSFPFTILPLSLHTPSWRERERVGCEVMRGWGGCFGIDVMARRRRRGGGEGGGRGEVDE